MTQRKLKWIGLGESEYVSKDGEFLVQLQDRKWHLFRRVEVNAEGFPSWTWSASLYSAKRKGECQDAAEDNPEAEAPATTPTPQSAAETTENDTRPALTNPISGATENTNATCWCCGVAFTKPAKGWRFGSLCGSHCMDVMVDVLSDVEALDT